MATGEMDTNSDPGCCKAMDSDTNMVLGGWPDSWHQHGLDSTMRPCDNTGHSGWRGSGGSMAAGHQYDHRMQPQMSVWPLMATWATDINIDPGCGRTMDSDTVLGCSPGSYLTSPGGSRPISLAWPLWQCFPQTPAWPQGATKTLGISMAFGLQ